MMTQNKEPQINSNTDILIGGGLKELVTILDIDREHGFILAQKNPDMIAGPQPSKGNRVRWPVPRNTDDNSPEIDSEIIFWNDETGIFAFKYNG